MTTIDATVAGAGSSPDGANSVYKPTLSSVWRSRGLSIFSSVFFLELQGLMLVFANPDKGRYWFGIAYILLGLLTGGYILREFRRKSLMVSHEGVELCQAGFPPLKLAWSEIAEVSLCKSDSGTSVGSSIWIQPVDTVAFLENKPPKYLKQWTKAGAYPFLGVRLSTDVLDMPWWKAFAEFSNHKPTTVLASQEFWYKTVRLDPAVDPTQPAKDLVYPATGNWARWTVLSALVSVGLGLVWFFALGRLGNALLVSAIVAVCLFGLFTVAAVAYFTSKTVLEKEGWFNSNVFGVRQGMPWREISKVLIRVDPSTGSARLHLVKKDYEGFPIEAYGGGKLSIYEATTGTWPGKRIVEAAGVGFPVDGVQMPLEELAQEILRRIEADRLAQEEGSH